MEKKQSTLELRQRLDKTLALTDLANEESIQSLVKDQLVHSSFCGNDGDLGKVVARRTKEVSNFLEMLRSASGIESDAFKAHGSSDSSQNDWKIKQDTDEFRVLYREGTRFHTLLAEGCTDGPIDVCLCVSWESTLYKKWWPQSNIPTFKITMSTCLQKVRIGEEISLVRLKVPWPISDREALLHYFEIEYFKEDLILVLINTISDVEHIDVSTHGFTRDGIPEAKDTVRIDLVGGFVLQKVSAHRSYFRTILNMDIKLDFMPPSLINFMSRQLIGTGYKLYQKTVGSVATSDDDDYREALKGPMYVRIREGLDARNKHETAPVSLEEDKHSSFFTEEHTVETTVDDPPVMHHTFVAEIVEEDAEHSPHLEGNPSMNSSPTDSATDQTHIIQKRPLISPEVEQALDILDRAIAIVRSNCSLVDQEIPALEPVAKAGCLSDEAPPINADTDKPSDKDEGRLIAEGFRCNGVSDSPKETPSASKKKQETIFNCSSHNKLIGAAVTPVETVNLDSMKACDEQSLKVNSSHENGPQSGTNKPKRKTKQRLCCLDLSLIRG